MIPAQTDPKGDFQCRETGSLHQRRKMQSGPSWMHGIWRAGRQGRCVECQGDGGHVVPAAGRFLSRTVYTMSYSLSYGFVFPVAFVAKSMPADNAVMHGLVDGARAANDWVDDLKHRKPSTGTAKPAAAGAQRRRRPRRRAGAEGGRRATRPADASSDSSEPDPDASRSAVADAGRSTQSKSRRTRQIRSSISGRDEDPVHQLVRELNLCR